MISGIDAKLLASTILGAPLGSQCERISVEVSKGETFAGFVLGDKWTFHLDAWGGEAASNRVFVVTA